MRTHTIAVLRLQWDALGCELLAPRVHLSVITGQAVHEQQLDCRRSQRTHSVSGTARGRRGNTGGKVCRGWQRKSRHRSRRREIHTLKEDLGLPAQDVQLKTRLILVITEEEAIAGVRLCGSQETVCTSGQTGVKAIQERGERREEERRGERRREEKRGEGEDSDDGG
jgi:hypothetical protein